MLQRFSFILIIGFLVAFAEVNGQAQFYADVQKVTVAGKENNYRFSVTIKSPDADCTQYADWWEVFSEDGRLIYRRILAHSHSNEQPFTRDGGPIKISPDQTVYIRAHMNNTGYGGQVMKGNVKEGFEPATLKAGFAADLETAEPQPSGCAY